MTGNNSGATGLFECDALVVGTGCAGLSAAVIAGHRGGYQD
jgi:succinate dehydrogenase/fumarate reductase flavoprotein subunit